MKKKLGILLALVALAVVGVLAGCSTSTSGDLDTIRLDWATYSPTSLVLKEKGWAEEYFNELGIEVVWVESQGSNRALEFLNSNSVDFGSTAGSAALVSKANNVPIEAVYIYSQPEWTALVTNGDSDINSVEDLAGKQVAATIGTDPFIFLLRALNEHGLTLDDIELVSLQHGDGGNALIQNQVDAWAGLDPHMARHELESDAKLFYRNTSFNTYGFLNVRSAFAEEYPEHVEAVIELYEKARAWALENQDELANILAEVASINPEVAHLQITERNNFSNPVIGEEHREALRAAASVLQSEGIIDADVDVEQVVNDLIQPRFVENVVK